MIETRRIMIAAHIPTDILLQYNSCVNAHKIIRTKQNKTFEKRVTNIKK